MGDWAGCSEANHQQQHNFHLAREGDNHYDLSATYAEAGREYVSQTADVGLHSNGLPRAQEIPRRVYAGPATMQNLFEGTSDKDKPPRNVCLHMEDATPISPLRSFDVDSLLAFPSSLAAFRTCLRWCPAKQVVYNIQADVHVEVEVRMQGLDGRFRTELRQLRNIPHLYLGTVDGFHQSAVYLFCPRLLDSIPDAGQRETNFLRNEQITRFVDQGMWPACRMYLEEDRVQHFPQSQGVAELNAQARGLEQRSSGNGRPSKQYATYPLQPAALGRIWEALQAQTRNPVNNLGDFEDSFLLLNAKGIKMDFKSSGSLFEAMSTFGDHLSSVLDMDYVQRTLIDVGGEICPPSALSHTSGSNSDASTYLWKKCCLEEIYKSLVDHGFEGKKGRSTMYHVGFLRDAACLTVEPPKRCWIREGGLVYCQWYASAKEIGNAQSCYPFQFDRLVELAVDESLWRANAVNAKTGRADGRVSLAQSYQTSKNRIREAYRASENTSYGLRTELRLEWPLFEAVRELAQETEQRHEPPDRLPASPRSAWLLTTLSYTRFMLGNYHKLILALETASITSPRTGIPLERTRLMATLIKCLQMFANGDLSWEPALWYDY